MPALLQSREKIVDEVDPFGDVAPSQRTAETAADQIFLDGETAEAVPPLKNL